MRYIYKYLLYNLEKDLKVRLNRVVVFGGSAVFVGSSVQYLEVVETTNIKRKTIFFAVANDLPLK